MHDAKKRKALEVAINKTRHENVKSLIRTIRKEAQLTWLTDGLEAAKDSPDLLRELFRLWVIDATSKTDRHRIAAARNYFGWQIDAKDFDDLKPEFLDAIYLLPPRDYAVIETLAPLVEHRAARRPAQSEEKKASKLLDIGTGSGLLIRILRRVGIRGKMLGIDPASSLTAYASRKLSSSDVEIEVGRIQDFDATGRKFQMALCYMVLHHVKKSQYQKALEIIFDALVEGGIFVYTDKFCARVDDANKPQPFDFKSILESNDLESIQELQVESSKLNSVKPFRPHPEKLDEYDRPWKKGEEILSKTGFLIQSVKPLNERVMLFVCRKPYTTRWHAFANMEQPRFKQALETTPKGLKRAPYHWTLNVLAKLFEDITGEPKCPDTVIKKGKGFLKGIAYFSWEKASRLFLVRRAQPFDFHILSYSHVHDGWGTLGRMIEDFEKNPRNYATRIGYTCLTRDAVQRTLPFQGDIENLDYEAAMAIPIYQVDDYRLRGAFLLYLRKREYVPLHTGSPLQQTLVEKFKLLNTLMNDALNKQEVGLKITDGAKKTCNQWERLANEKPENAVIARLEIKRCRKTHGNKSDPAGSLLSLSDVCSRIQAQLAGSECFSVLDDGRIKRGEATILVAARWGTSYDEIRERILGTVGSAAEKSGPFRYECKLLGAKEPLKVPAQPKS